MITIKQIAFGNSSEAYIQSGFTNGLNIISSSENHIGKTLIMQAMMYALGSAPMFPASFPAEDYVFLIDLEINGNRSLSILRSGNTFIIKEGDTVTPIESVHDFDRYWSNHIFELPRIIKDGKVHIVSTDLFEQMAFMPQAKRNTARIYGGRYKKDDFMEMIYAQAGLVGKTLNDGELTEIKNKKQKLETRKKELSKKSKKLSKMGSALTAISPTADREETDRLIAELEKLGDEITELKKQKNRFLTRKVKNEGVLCQLRSLNNSLDVDSLECLVCGSREIGYRMNGSKFIFDITTSDMRSQIINSLKERISEQENIAKELDLEIREKQTRFNKITDSRNITLEDIFVYREDYISLEDIDKELTLIADELSNVDRIIKTDKQISAKNKVDRKNLKDKIVAKMNKIHRKLGNNDGSPDYSDLFTTEGKPYSGSEATEFLMARMYALVDCLHHQLPILVDSFRAEELSTGREEKMLPLFKDLENQVILTATLKEQEIGKYWGIEWINNIDLSGYTPNKLLSSKYCAEFANEIERFGVKLMQL